MEKDSLISKINSDKMNSICFDCGEEHPVFVSVNNGIFLCAQCATVHMSFPQGVSVIENNDLKALSENELKYLAQGGNTHLNDFILDEFPKLENYSQKLLYKTRGMDYYRKRLDYYVNGGAEPKKPSQIVGCQLIPDNYYRQQQYNFKEKQQKYEPKTRTYRPDNVKSRKYNIKKNNENEFDNEDEFFRDPFFNDNDNKFGEEEKMFKKFFGNDDIFNFKEDNNNNFGFGGNKMKQAPKYEKKPEPQYQEKPKTFFTSTREPQDNTSKRNRPEVVNTRTANVQQRPLTSSNPLFVPSRKHKYIKKEEQNNNNNNNNTNYSNNNTTYNNKNTNYSNNTTYSSNNNTNYNNKFTNNNNSTYSSNRNTNYNNNNSTYSSNRNTNYNNNNSTYSSNKNTNDNNNNTTFSSNKNANYNNNNSTYSNNRNTNYNNNNSTYSSNKNTNYNNNTTYSSNNNNNYNNKNTNYNNNSTYSSNKNTNYNNNTTYSSNNNNQNTQKGGTINPMKYVGKNIRTEGDDNKYNPFKRRNSTELITLPNNDKNTDKDTSLLNNKRKQDPQEIPPEFHKQASGLGQIADAINEKDEFSLSEDENKKDLDSSEELAKIPEQNTHKETFDEGNITFKNSIRNKYKKRKSQQISENMKKDENIKYPRSSYNNVYESKYNKGSRGGKNETNNYSKKSSTHSDKNDDDENININIDGTDTPLKRNYVRRLSKMKISSTNWNINQLGDNRTYPDVIEVEE
jgi:hypothetical protein